ncbi:sensor histidine kinase [uncultured Aeromicrobium sp.]|uniref:sensor histidine kinase n=1 Tax=uncultured Aeromicrobium sp. TaxID=337820 RepID=UPI0025E9C471|nr:histidine kinase [uncultured Aeromicrobium sp.]
MLAQLGRTREAYVNSLIERSERVAREADQRAQLAAQSERNRIAREMHDVVAHGLSVIIVQADGARYAAAARPEAATEALENIAATGREALTEMRSLLGLLREGDTGVTPQPDLADLPALIDEARASMTLETAIDDDLDAVPSGVALTAYRLVQEALTNVRKHAGPDVHVSVRVQREGTALRVQVRDDGRGASAHDDGGGHGLLGMRERVAAHGGELTAGPVGGGGYLVDARIPW